MEFKLNKIDPELRKQVNEVTKEGVIHPMDHKLNVNKENRDEHGKQPFQEHFEKKKKILVNAVKEESISIEAFSEEDELNTNIKGRFLDIRK